MHRFATLVQAKYSLMMSQQVLEQYSKGGAPPNGLQMPFTPNNMMNQFNNPNYMMPGMMPNMGGMGAPAGAGNGMQMPNQMFTNLN